MGEKVLTSPSGDFFPRGTLSNIFSFANIKIGSTFLIMCFFLVSIGFDINVFSFLKSCATYLFLIHFHSRKIHVLEKYSLINDAAAIPYSTISLLAFSQSDFLRGLDAALLIASLSLTGLALFSQRKYRKKIFSYALITSSSHSFYSLFIEYYRSSDFLSLINYIQIFLSIMLIIISALIFIRGNDTQNNIKKNLSATLSIGCFLILTQSKKTDFYWDSMIWSSLIWLFSLSSFMVIVGVGLVYC